ncbi:efflux RND transporter periplasmic adaptor subunit [Falsiphaeobacter marinintestinus]|uniref:efflux RND transporter periplasmic adaptor subunit n=1 Tax=Falsiphaeobacter marinintestinus TaxID=1492905 RepID=UPI0011B84717|nr:HlyD family efflux transporter periplasmic adaptor subunit [Phaeobacter marinintestinus]
MAHTRKYSRPVLIAVSLILVGAGLTVAFWPKPTLVDTADVVTGPMIMTVNEEGRTEVHETYVVSAPVAGELQRVTLQPGDKVVKDETIVARMLPTNPSALDVRTREQAQAAVHAAEAALRVAQADLNAARANSDFAVSELERTKKLIERQIVSDVALQRANQTARVAKAMVETALAAIAQREAELNNARARLIGFEDQGLASALGESLKPVHSILLRSPIDGTVLKVITKSEKTLLAGEPILEIGDVTGDLEVVAELLSSDAVQVQPGHRVIITNWGGAGDLHGVVDRIDPYGYTKFSALGVEEQRVETRIDFTDAKQDRANLGHGYRVEVRIVVWERDDALIVPSAALFRQGRDWAVFEVSDGVATLKRVSIGRNNGIEAEVLDGLEDGSRVVLFPASTLEDGAPVEERG